MTETRGKRLSSLLGVHVEDICRDCEDEPPQYLIFLGDRARKSVAVCDGATLMSQTRLRRFIFDVTNQVIPHFTPKAWEDVRSAIAEATADIEPVSDEDVARLIARAEERDREAQPVGDDPLAAMQEAWERERIIREAEKQE